MIPSRYRILGPTLAALLLFGCRPGAEEVPPEARDTIPAVTASLVRTITESGFAAPTSVVHDPAADLYLVSNLNLLGAAPDTPQEEAGKGFISRVTPGGDVLELRWIQAGAPGVTLDEPRGLAILADTLLVTDGRCIRRFHRDTGQPLSELCVEQATRFQDVAVDSGGDVFFSDAGSDVDSDVPSGENPGAVYLLRQHADVPQKLALMDGTLLGEGRPHHPGPMATDRFGLVVAGYGSGGIWRVDPRGERTQIVPSGALEADGLVSLGERGLLACSRDASAVLWVDAEGRVTPVLEGLEAPGDMGFDAGRNRLLIPLIQAGELRVVQIQIKGGP